MAWQMRMRFGYFYILCLTWFGMAIPCAAVGNGLVAQTHQQVAGDPDCDALRAQLARLWRADSTQVTRLATQVRDCYLLGGQSNWGAMGKAQADTLMRIFQIGIRFDGAQRGHWLNERALMSTLRMADYKQQARGWLMEAIAANPDEPSIFFFISALVRIEGDYLRGQLPLGEAIANWSVLDRLFLLHELSGADDAAHFADLQARYRLKLRAAMPDCDRLSSMYGERIAALRLPADSCRTYLTLYALQGCDAPGLWDAALTVALQARDDADLRRLAGAEAYNRGAWQESRTHWQRVIALGTDLRLQAADHVQVAQTWLAQGDHRQARASLQAAMRLHPTWGEPIVQLIDLYLDGNALCGGSTFDQAAIYWLLIDLCHQLLNVDPSYAIQANERLYHYRSLAPSAAEAAIHGFKPGDTYPFKCWMSTTTTVPLD